LEPYLLLLYNRVPLIGGWARRLAARALAAEGSPVAVGALAGAVARSEDKRVRAIALEALGQLTNPKTREAAADYLCQQWAATRAPQLEEVMLRERFVAAEPPVARALSALKNQQPELLLESGAEIVEPLAQAIGDRDEMIAGQARLALRQLKNPEAKDEVCRLVVERDDPAARAAALEAGYAPRDEHQRALFFFLTEQWERYEALDFDRRLLRAVYEAADAVQRQRVTEKLRAAGRADFLTVIAGGDYRSRAAVMSPGEADFLAQMLAAHKEWAKLWMLAFDLPFSSSARIVRLLNQAGWRPEQSDEQEALAQLTELAATEMAMSSEEISRFLPPAIERARVRVAGRVNDVAFAPNHQVIASGARVSSDGKRAALLYDGVTFADLPKLKGLTTTAGWEWNGVARSADFAPDDESLIVGKFNGEVLVCRHGQPFLEVGARPFFQHAAQAQGVKTLGERGVVITAGADGHVQFTSWANRAPIGSLQIGGERLTSLRVSPDGSFMAIGDSDASMSLWDLRALDVPALFARPLACAAPAQMAAVSALAESANLDPRAQRALKFLELMLRHRFQYDIEVDEVPVIQAGEFDIEIEG
jgi:hypothetical protein